MMPRLTSRLQPLAMLLLSALLAFVFLATTGCRSQRPADAPTPASTPSLLEQPQPISSCQVDSSSVQVAAPPDKPTPADFNGFLGIGAGKQYRNAMEGWAAGELAKQGKSPGPRKIKGDGNQTNTAGSTNTSATGKKAQALQADSGAVVNQSTKPRAPQAIGHGNTATQVKPPPFSPSPWWWLWLIVLAGGAYGIHRLTS